MVVYTRWFLIALFLSLSYHMAFANDKKEDTIQVRFQIFVLNGTVLGETSLREGFDDVWDGSDDDWKELGGAVTLFDRGKFRFDNDELYINGDGCFWNKKRIPFEDQPSIEWPKHKIRKIYSPIVHLDQYESSTIKIHSDQTYDYMQKREDGLFELKHIVITTGLDITVRPKEKHDRIVFDEMWINVRAVGKREDISGVSLPIGKPVVSTHKYKLELELSERKIYGALLRLEESQGFVLICFDADD